MRLVPLRNAWILPERMKPDELYLFMCGEDPWLLAMYCPCGCGRILRLHVDATQRGAAAPPWTVSIREGKLSLLQSVTVNPCGTTFTLRASQPRQINAI